MDGYKRDAICFLFADITRTYIYAENIQLAKQLFGRHRSACDSMINVLLDSLCSAFMSRGSPFGFLDILRNIGQRIVFDGSFGLAVETLYNFFKIATQ